MISPGGVAPSRMVRVSAFVIFPCTIKSRRFVLALAHLGSPEKRAVKWLCVCVCIYLPVQYHNITSKAYRSDNLINVRVAIFLEESVV